MSRPAKKAKKRKAETTKKTPKKASESPSPSSSDGVPASATSSAPGPGPRGLDDAKANCVNCETEIPYNGKALFVEEEVGRIFCSEKCIVSFFEGDIEKLEKEYYEHQSIEDLTAEEREAFGQLRWKTLEEPDEVWVERTISGDHRYYLIGRFEAQDRPIWSICITLMLRGEPSFLYLSFITADESLLNHYRRGDPIQWNTLKKQSQEAEVIDLSDHVLGMIQPQPEEAKGDSAEGTSDDNEEDEELIDGLADPWTQDETYRAVLNQERRADDIPAEEFPTYETNVESTLEAPDEVWLIERKETDQSPSKTYHFIKHYPDGAGHWYIIIARETDEDDEIEILDCFPTRDPDLADKYRVGVLEIDGNQNNTGSRMVH